MTTPDDGAHDVSPSQDILAADTSRERNAIRPGWAHRDAR
jgi:hypothetical protein